MLRKNGYYLATGNDSRLQLTRFFVKGKLGVVDRICLVLYGTSLLCAAIVIVMFFIEHKQYNSTQYMLHTDYLHWNTPVPAISVCQYPDEAQLTRLAANTVESTKERLQLTTFYRGLLRPGIDGFCVQCAEGCGHCPQQDYTALLHKNLTKKCEDLFKKCTWNGEHFDCCRNFVLLMTGQGKCYSMNSRHTSKDKNSAMFVVNESNPEADLKITVTSPVQVYVHDPGDVNFARNQETTVMTDRSIQNGQKAIIEYTFREISTDSTAALLSMHQRNCTLPEETELRYYSRYSVTACRAECKIANQMKLCNCIHHLMAKAGLPVCDFKGLQCLQHFFWTPSEETKKYKRKMKVKCQCMPECEFMEINLIRYTIHKNDGTSARVRLNSPPTERLVLQARVSTLDIIVGFACVSRLFTSTSFLQIAQTFQFIVINCRLRPRGYFSRGRPNQQSTDMQWNNVQFLY